MERHFPIHKRHVHVHHVLCECNIEGLPHILASNIGSQIPRLLHTNSSVFAGTIVPFKPTAHLWVELSGSISLIKTSPGTSCLISNVYSTCVLCLNEVQIKQF